MVLCEVITKANELEPARRDEPRRIKTKDRILRHLQEVGAGMYTSLTEENGLPIEFRWTDDDVKTARWAAQMMADGGIRYEDLDSSWFVQAASALILNKHNIGIALYDDDSDTSEEEESVEHEFPGRTMEGPAEEHSGILPASFRSLCNFL